MITIDKAVDKIVSHTALFSALSENAKDKLKLAGEGRYFQKNEILFSAGEIGRAVFILLEGAVKLYNLTDDGREVIVKLVKPSEMFAEAILYADHTYPVHATAVIDSQLFLISRSLFYDLLDEAKFRDIFLANIMNRLRYLTKRIFYLSAYDVETRFFNFLRDRYGIKEFYEIEYTKKEFASAIGTIPETLSRLLLRLSERKILTWKDSYIEIHDPTVWDNVESDDQS